MKLEIDFATISAAKKSNNTGVQESYEYRYQVLLGNYSQTSTNEKSVYVTASRNCDKSLQILSYFSLVIENFQL